jgi:hypothetical protein
MSGDDPNTFRTAAYTLVAPAAGHPLLQPVGGPGVMIDRILFWIRLVALVNFVLLAFGAHWLGGDAYSGHAEGGHYFLATGGELVEVSRNVWMYSYVHVISNFVTGGLAVVALTVMAFRGLLGIGDRPGTRR